MKQLKSSLRDLREVFERGITLKDISEPLASFDADRDASDVRSFLDERDYDIVGVRLEGVAAGYARRSNLISGKLADHLEPFPIDLTISSTASLLRAFEALLESPYVFVDILGRVGGIVTRGDLQKAPVRMWLFGVISLIEMQMLRILRERHRNHSWQQLISGERLLKANAILEDRRTRNEAIDLADCLQFGDKANILVKDDTIRAILGFSSRAQAQKFFTDLQHLRDDLAHSQDIVSGNRPSTLKLIQNAEDALLKLEAFESPGDDSAA